MFSYRPLADDPEVTTARLTNIPVSDVEDPTVAHLLHAKHRELMLLVQMLSCRGSAQFLALSIEAFGAVGPTLLKEAEDILDTVSPGAPDPGPWLDAKSFVELAQAELDQYRAFAPDVESHVELRDGSTGVMVSNGDLLVAPTARVSTARVEALLHHEIGTHVLTFVNGSHQQLRTLASGLAGHEETQEGLAVLAEYLGGGLTANRLRQLAARVVAVHQMISGAEFPEVHDDFVDAGHPDGTGVHDHDAGVPLWRSHQGCGVPPRAARARGPPASRTAARAPVARQDASRRSAARRGAAPTRGVLTDPLLTPRYLDDARARARLAHIHEIDSLAALIGATS